MSTIPMIRHFMRHKASGGIVLMAATILAMLVANTPLYEYYHKFLYIHFQIGLANGSEAMGDIFGFSKPLVLWINDGLMALFFLMVGLEIKREFKVGELSTPDRIILPAIAALGGIAIPVLIFYGINYNYPEYLGAWAVPAATDIAFALSVLALLPARIPVALKVLLTALAIMDDLAAIVIIAIFYTHDLSLEALLFSLVCLGILWTMNRKGIKSLGGYLIIGWLMWVAVLKSGIHATLAGVLVAMFIPMEGKNGIKDSPLEKLEHSLAPWIAFAVVPIFGFANAGIRFVDITMEDVFSPLTIGVGAGLFIGKQLGIFSAIFFAVKSGLVPMIKGANWKQIHGISILGGIGFTMSLFIGELAIHTGKGMNELRLGIMAGSLLSAVIGYILLNNSCSEVQSDRERHREYIRLDKLNRKKKRKKIFRFKKN